MGEGAYSHPVTVRRAGDLGVEHVTLKRLVQGSIPTSLSKIHFALYSTG